MIRKMLDIHASSPEPGEVGGRKVYHTPTGRSEVEDKELMRQAILKEIRKVVKNLWI